MPQPGKDVITVQSLSGGETATDHAKDAIVIVKWLFDQVIPTPTQC